MNHEDFQLLCDINRQGKLTGIAKTYFRLVTADRNSKGVRLSAEEVSDMVAYDEAVTRVLYTVIEDYVEE